MINQNRRARRGVCRNGRASVGRRIDRRAAVKGFAVKSFGIEKKKDDAKRGREELCSSLPRLVILFITVMLQPNECN